MIEVFGDIWKYQLADFICITTNGDVRKDGCAVMGRGLALQAKQKFLGIDRKIGNAITENGNHLYMIDKVCTFPVKHHWYEKADLKLIERSAHELAVMVNHMVNVIFVLPRPGCGNGGLKWQVVKPIIDPILPDSVHVIERI